MTSARAFTPAWIIGQRWFRSKQRPIASVAEVDRAMLPGVDAHLLVLAVAYTDGGAADRYLVPTGADGEPRDGEGVWAALVSAISHGAELGSTHGRFRCSPTPTLQGISADALGERSVGVEQSNSSVVLGERLILKLYRLLEDGESPDTEVSRFLEAVGFADAPAVAGAITYESDGSACTAAMLQSFVPSSGDGWEALLQALAQDPGSAVSMVERIGQLTASMHSALASRPEVPNFPARPASTAEAAGWRTSAEHQLAQALSAVSGQAYERLVALAPLITARFADAFGSASGGAPVSRIHGDYHLGQLLLRPDGGFSVIDFEGEPARPLVERRRPSSPLRDVAGLIRSLDYAARSTEQRGSFDAGTWLDEARSAFSGAYGGIGDHEVGLLAAFELEKACYEVRYEASNRPEWLWLPLAAVERLAHA